MKKPVNVFEYTEHICKAMPKGILLTTSHAGRVNTMTIGWGMMGIEWGKPIFVALVRESRYTKELLDASGEFTVNVPFGDTDGKILGFCGTKSGRDIDKIEQMGLTLETPETISTPGLREFPLTLECKVLYKQEQQLSGIPAPILERYYPQNVPSTESGKNRDPHTAYYAEIVNAYLITD
ncbi:MAG: flavin reductase family protein [Oscillospiraceae bacterium]|nr:flavin reductase family protein [Oscillospiraceae bacterium]